MVGREADCEATWAGLSSAGRLLLETDELLFRGDRRLKIPLRDVVEATAKGGDLVLRWKGGTARFALGPAAGDWARRILNPKGRLEKLGVKPGATVALTGPLDADFASEIAAAHAKLTKGAADLRFLGLGSADGLKDVRGAAKALSGAQALWIVYPKGRKDVTEAMVLEAGRAAGLTDVKVVRFSETHTALKFVIPVDQR